MKQAAPKVYTKKDIEHIATLANIPVTDSQLDGLVDGFTKTMKVVDQLSEVDVTWVEPTSQVTGMENVFRDDEVDESRMFTQEEALANAKRTHEGFFVVDQILEK